MSKNQVDNRIALIGIAKDLLLQDYYEKRDVIIRDWREVKKGDKPSLPKFPDTHDVMATAKVLYAFVDNS